MLVGAIMQNTTQTKNKLKDPISFEEQLVLLESRNLIIDDRDEALNILQTNNYYRISAYFIPFYEGEKKNRFKDGTTFSDIYNLYRFDSKLRSLIFKETSNIEIAFRTHIAYYLSTNHDKKAHRDEKYFKDSKRHKDFLRIIDKTTKKCDDPKEPFIRHYKDKYDNRYPLWVIIETFQFGTLSKMFKNLKSEYKKDICKDYYNINFKFIEKIEQHFILLFYYNH